MLKVFWDAGAFGFHIEDYVLDVKYFFVQFLGQSTRFNCGLDIGILCRRVNNSTTNRYDNMLHRVLNVQFFKYVFLLCELKNEVHIFRQAGNPKSGSENKKIQFSRTVKSN